MRRWTLVVLALAACSRADRVNDARALVLSGEWRLELKSESQVGGTPETGRIALVAVRRDEHSLPGTPRLLAAGAVTMDEGTIERRVSDGTRVVVHPADGDSVLLRFASARGEYYVNLVGALRGDTISGVWQSVLARSSGSGGGFLMVRQR
jgi:hypothetical protein